MLILQSYEQLISLASGLNGTTREFVLKAATPIQRDNKLCAVDRIVILNPNLSLGNRVYVQLYKRTPTTACIRNIHGGQTDHRDAGGDLELVRCIENKTFSPQSPDMRTLRDAIYATLRIKP